MDSDKSPKSSKNSDKLLKLTSRQEKFCQEYIIDLHGTNAAIRAGYSKLSARQSGCDNLRKPQVRARLEELTKERSKRTKIDQDWVVKRFVEVVERCMQHEEVMVRDGSGKLIGTGEFRFDSNGANTALRELSKHTGGFAKDQDKADDKFYEFAKTTKEAWAHRDKVLRLHKSA